MEKISKFFIENSKLTVVLSIGMLIYGYMGLMRMNAESFPSVSMATAIVTTPYDGASTGDIETKITKPIEDEIRTVSGLKNVRSTSQAGMSTIVVRVDMDDPKVNVKETMDEVQKAIDRVTDLPPDLKDKPKFTEINSEEFPVIELAIAGDNTNRNRDLVADLLKEEIEDNKNIKSVQLKGFAERAFQIELDHKKLLEKHIAVDEVIAKVLSRNTNSPGGEIRSETSQQLIRLEGKVRNIEELRNLVIRSNFTGETILLKDIAKVEDSEAEVKVKTRYNGIDATVVVISKKAGSDTLDIVDDINAKLKSFRERHPEYVYNIFNNEGLKVKNRVEVLANNAFTGLILVIVFLFIFLPGKIGIVASMSLPLAVMGTMGLMPAFGMNIDAITVLALVIALGMLVDNSVVISENFTRLRQEGMPPKNAAVESVRMLWLPITATAFTTIAAFLPMLVTKGVMGEFIKWIPIIVTMSLMLSLIESFFFLPMRLALAGKQVKKVDSKGNSDWFSKFEKKFEVFMDKVVGNRYKVAGGFTVLLIFSFYMMVGANKFILFPAEQTERYITRIDFPKGTRLKETNRLMGVLSKKVKDTIPSQAEHIISYSGQARTDLTDPKSKDGNNVGMLIITVNEETKNNVPHTEVLKKLRTIEMKEATALEFSAQVNGPPVGNAIEATFRSNSNTDLDEVISKIKAKLIGVKGVSDLQVDDVIGDDEIYVKIDYLKADRLGLDVANIGSIVRAAISGRRIVTVTLDNKDVDIIARFQEDERTSIEDLSQITVRDPRGNLVPLGTFVNFEKTDGSPQIKRYDFKRAKTLTGNVDEENITSMAANAILMKEYQKLKNEYTGVSLKFGGAQENTKESMESLFNALVLSLIGIFALLVFLFKSYLRPAIIMSTIPLGLFGFSVAFFFHGRPISFLALIGVIGLGGIIVNSGIVLISFIDQLKEEGKLSLHEILVKASGMRLRAVLVTSLTTISGLIPTAYGIGGTDSILVAMTMAMAWGLTSGTILTLVWVPAAYAILEDYISWVDKIFNNFKNRKSERNLNSDDALTTSGK